MLCIELAVKYGRPLLLTSYRHQAALLLYIFFHGGACLEQGFEERNEYSLMSSASVVYWRTEKVTLCVHYSTPVPVARQNGKGSLQAGDITTK